MSDATATTLADAIARQRRGDDHGAEEAFRTLLRGDPTNLNLLVGHAAALLGLRRFEEANQTLARAAILAPDNPDVLAHLGLALYGLGRLARGAEHFTRAIALTPERRDLAALWESIRSKPYLASNTSLQSRHAPARQVFMSAALDHVRRPGAPLTILEVGSYMGASLLTWANAVHRLHVGPASIMCVDAWGAQDEGEYPELNRALRSNHAFEVFLHNADVARKHAIVHYIQGLSANVLPLLRDRQFDVVYIDASHYYDEVLSDITEGKRLVRDGGILCGDDLELQADECDLANARENPKSDYIEDPRSGRHHHPGVTVAVSDAFGRVSSFDGFWAMQMRDGRFEQVSLEKARGVLPPHWPAEEIDKTKAYFAASCEIAALV